jgi:hypothetical protein
MRRRWALFWSLVILGLVAGTVTLAWIGRAFPLAIQDPNYPGAQAQIIFALGTIPLLAVGWLLTARATGNPYGWLWLALALVSAAQWLIQTMADFLLRRGLQAGDVVIAVPGPDGYLTGVGGGRLPLAQWLGLVGDYGWFTLIALLGLLLLLFPDGRLPTPRWSWLTRLIAGTWLLAASVLWMSGAVSGTAPVQHPLGLIEPNSTLDKVLDYIVLGVALGLISGVVAGVAAIVFRFWRSHGLERQQTKWVMLGGLLFLPTFVWDAPGVWDPVVETLGGAAMPAAVALAVLRYRLYQIDRIVSRTVSYALVVAVLAGVYVGGVFVMQELLPLEGDLPVAATTLGVAALFNPIRRRVQSWIDRRFDRSRYDAEQIVMRFSSRLRDQVSIHVVETDVRTVVGQVLHPTRISIWIRE